MQDGIIKGTGNSRYLKSNISADTTLSELIAMLRAGTFPVDLNGINEAGWQQLATALNKANLLSDATAALLGGASTPDAALTKLKEFIAENTSLANSKAKIATGSYTGTGTYGSSSPNSLTFDFAPKLLLLVGFQYADLSYGFLTATDAQQMVSFDELTTAYTCRLGFALERNDLGYGKKSADGKTYYWYNTGNFMNQLNVNGFKYHYVVIG